MRELSLLCSVGDKHIEMQTTGGVTMLVTVIIKREVAEGREKEFFFHLKRLRMNAMNQEGYISGETLICAENTRKVAVLGKWESLDSWYDWKNSGVRAEIDNSLRKYQINDTLYEPYVFSKYKAAAEQGFPPPLQKIA